MSTQLTQILENQSHPGSWQATDSNDPRTVAIRESDAEQIDAWRKRAGNGTSRRGQRA